MTDHQHCHWNLCPRELELGPLNQLALMTGRKLRNSSEEESKI